VASIAATTTRTGLSVHAELDVSIRSSRRSAGSVLPAGAG
jgi:hypothetical protein